MATSPFPPPFAAIVVAAGRGLRAGQPIPKQFALWRRKPVLRHSVEALRAAGAMPLVVIIPAGGDTLAAAALEGVADVTLVTGGDTRQLSVRAGLEALAADPPERVLIHDAARPLIPHEIITRLLEALEGSCGAIPTLPVVDSLVVAQGAVRAGKADREALRRVQTPQAFRYTEILAAHRAWTGPPDAGDDAEVLGAWGGEVVLIEGSETLKKLTLPEDFTSPPLPVRCGTGYDVHRLVEGEELWLGGIRIAHDKGLSGHSDADVVLHAVVDALLGAIGDGDIGSHFPPSDPQWKGAPSSAFVRHAAERIAAAGYRLGNLDLTIICEAPRIGPHRDAMRAAIAGLLGVDIAQVSVKATTTEQLGFTGRGEGIAAQAIVTLMANES